MLRIGVVMYQTSLTKGQELVAQRMVREFRKQGYEAFLITSIYHDWEPRVDLEEVRRRGGYIHLFDDSLRIPVLRVSSEGVGWPPRRISFLDFTVVLGKVIDDLKLNVLITHSTLWNGPEEVAKFVEWRRNMIKSGSPQSPMVFCQMSHFQEPDEERYTVYERSYREAWNSLSLPQIVSKADIVLVTTPSEKEFMKKLEPDDAKFLLFPGGVEDDALKSASPHDFRDNHGLPGNARIVSFLGTVEERKNIFSLLEVAKLLSQRNDIHFVIAGRIEGEYGAKAKEQAKELQNVSFLGPVSEEDKASLILSSYLNFTMSRAEALGLSQLEFMAAGVPVVTSGVGGQSWIVNNDVNGMVLKGPDDVKGAADVIAKLVDEPSHRNRLGKKAVALSSDFSMTRLIYFLSKRLQQVIQKLSERIPTAQGMQPEEKVIEARVSRGRRVVATSRRLIVTSVENGREAIEVPYNEISKIVRHVQASWKALALGLAVTVLLLASTLLDSPLEPYLRAALGMAFLGSALRDSVALSIRLIRFLPLIVSVLVFGLTLRKGYLVLYGSSKKIFLPKEFLGALKFVDRLTPQNLFVDYAELL